MPSVLVIRHGADAGPGYLGEALAATGLPTREVDPVAGEELPGVRGFGGVVSLGGSMGAYEEERYSWLAVEKRLLAEAVEAGIPTLGICLGCQLLADALGGRAYPSGGWELGTVEVTLTQAGRVDPVMRHLDGPVAVSHTDTWDLPPGATLLAMSDRYRHAFLLGSGLGLQAHPEVSPAAFARWVRDMPREDLLRDGVDPEAAIAAVRANGEAQQGLAARLFGAWAAQIRRFG